MILLLLVHFVELPLQVVSEAAEEVLLELVDREALVLSEPRALVVPSGGHSITLFWGGVQLLRGTLLLAILRLRKGVRFVRIFLLTLLEVEWEVAHLLVRLEGNAFGLLPRIDLRVEGSKREGAEIEGKT